MAPTASFAKTSTQVMYRLYNKYSGEHLYTADASEKTNLVKIGWNDEGVGWIAPTKSKTPVYRLYNKYSGDHHYTTSKGEYDACVRQGWNGEGVGFYSDDAKGVTVYRLYNKYLIAGTHHYTTSKNEYDYLGKIGWSQENIGWYGVDNQGDTKEITYDDEVIVVKGFTQNGNKYTFTSSQNTSGRDPKVGDKIAIEPGTNQVDGTCGVVTSVTTSNGKTVVTVKQASELDELFESIAIDEDAVRPVMGEVKLADGVEYDTSAQSTGDSLELYSSRIDGWTLNLKISEQKLGKYGSGNLELKYTPYVDVDWHWSAIDGVKSAKLALGGEMDFQGSFKAKTKNEISIPVAKVPFSVGAATIWANVDIVCTVSGEITFEMSFDSSAGVEYKNGKLNPYWKLYEYDAKTKLGAEAKFGVSPWAALDILSISCFDLEADAGVKASGSTTLRKTGLVCDDVTAGMYLEVSSGNHTVWMNAIGLTLTKSAWKDKDSPLRYYQHYENGKPVAECTYGKEVNPDPDPEPNPDIPDESDFVTEDWGKGLCVVDYIGELDSVVVPSTINGSNVLSINLNNTEYSSDTEWTQKIKNLSVAENPNLTQFVMDDEANTSTLESINLSNASGLEQIGISDARSLSSINLEGLTKLWRINFINYSGHTAGNLDVSLSDNDSLREVFFNNQMSKNQIRLTINLSECPNLIQFQSENCNVNDLDFSQNSKLNDLTIRGGYLDSIDLSKNLELEDLQIIDTNLSILDLSKNTSLKGLGCQDNELTNLILPDGMLYEVICDGNSLEHIDADWIKKQIDKTAQGLLNSEKKFTLWCSGNNLDNVDEIKSIFGNLPDGVVGILII